MKKPIDFAKAPAMDIGHGNRCTIQSVKPENIFNFPEGILGFEHIKEYVFLLNEKVEPFMFMQALHETDLSFVCIETFLIKPDYVLSLPDWNVNFLELKRPEDAFLVSLVTVRKNVEDITANLMSPIVINMKNSKAQQVIVENSVYPVKYRIWDAIENSADIFKTG